MHLRLVLYGLAIWAAATAALRFADPRMLHPDSWPRILILFAISFPLMMWLVLRLCKRFGLKPDAYPAGAISLCLPTLLLDPFSSVFFHSAFPNLAPESAGVFGGWMLWCCAGALVGGLIGARRTT